MASVQGIAMDADERELVRASMRHTLATSSPADATAALLADGWTDLVAADPAAAITLLAEEAGRARSAVPVADLAMLWGAGIEADATSAVVVDGLLQAGAERASRFVVVATDGITAHDAATSATVAVGGFDPALALRRVTALGHAAEVLGDAAAAARAIAAGRRALATQMIGAVDQMLADTVAHVTDRHQYGRAIGSFQSVKHRLADVRVAATAARSGTAAAWETGDAVSAIAAKCLAGRAQQLASTHCFQVHGGIAFTVEHGFQQWVRRGLLLDLLLGGHEQLTTELGRRLLDGGRVPRVPSLHGAPTKG